jgi:hypothetical protein
MPPGQKRPSGSPDGLLHRYVLRASVAGLTNQHALFSWARIKRIGAAAAVPFARDFDPNERR